ncbi:MAG: GNAT family N-acetyltransferase [Anaerolineales bacterium]|nr:GNAT family N-acetyltransferase [Chloroflexota bacterium]MBL6982342.1 GNAT family N-acetyltransferase [Anaerolineales bacterium]
MADIDVRLIEDPGDMVAVEELQRVVWPGGETEIVPVHMLRAITNNGGVLLGVYDADLLVGFVFGFPGLDEKSVDARPKHASHLAAIHPDYRDLGLGFELKRAQWQIVRSQGLDHIIWTYDPLESRNANLNISKLGAVCNTYIPEYYGEMHDGLNVGMPSDRFKVDWWVNTRRVEQRLNVQQRNSLSLDQFTSSGALVINPAVKNDNDILEPGNYSPPHPDFPTSLLLVEIPSNFQTLKELSADIALAWRLQTRDIFGSLFASGYIVTDFIFEHGDRPRSFYVLSYGEAQF